MDIVIPLHEWSGTENAELRYSLRSFEKFMPHDKVVLIGFKPKWTQTVEHHAFKDDNQPAFREANIFLKLQWYIKNHNDGSDFIYTNDDHFLLKEFNPAPPYPYKGTLLESFSKRRPDDPYHKAIDNTIKISSNKNYDYDVHAPMLINPKIFTDVFSRINWSVKYGYLLKTLYAQGFEGYRALDLKIMEPPTVDALTLLAELQAADLSFFTTSDKAFSPVMEEAMKRLYPVKSRYEK